MRTEGSPHDRLLQLSTLAHTETVGFEDAGCCKAAYSECHKLLTERSAIITKNGGVARELTSTDWAKLSKMVVSHPFDSSKLD